MSRRFHPFEVVGFDIVGNPKVDLEYINDYVLGGKRIFTWVCEIDSTVESAFLSGAVSGYVSANNGAVSQRRYVEDKQYHIMNKGYIALWGESKGGEVFVFGIYRHDNKVYLVSAKWKDLEEYIAGSGGVLFSERFRQGILHPEECAWGD